MKLAEIKAKATGLNISPGGTNKTDLIRRIQKAEGYEPCFGTAKSACPYTDCCFRSDCLGGKAARRTA